MIRVGYTQKFVRMFEKLPPPLQDEVEQKIELFKHAKNHRALRVHKLKGALSGRYSFSVNYRFRILFAYINNDTSTALLLAVGDHSIYN